MVESGMGMGDRRVEEGLGEGGVVAAAEEMARQPCTEKERHPEASVGIASRKQERLFGLKKGDAC